MQVVFNALHKREHNDINCRWMGNFSFLDFHLGNVPIPGKSLRERIFPIREAIFHFESRSVRPTAHSSVTEESLTDNGCCAILFTVMLEAGDDYRLQNDKNTSYET